MCQKENEPIDDFIAELQHIALVLNWNPPPTMKATNAKVTTYLAARQLNRPASPFTEVELPTAHPVTPAEDDGEAHIRILVPAVQYVLEYLAQFHLALELCTTAANPPRSVLRRQ
ncbi:hypothetical protein MRX96_043002 [Rhipicephalus microplus]